MENTNGYKDGTPVSGFFDDACAEDIVAALPSLCYSNIKLIREHYERLDTAPTYGALRVMSAILDRRRGQTEGALVSALGCDSLCLIETYNDLTAKAEVIYGKSRHGYTLTEYTETLGKYMRRVGRYDSRRFASVASGKEKSAALTVLYGDTPVLTLGGKEKTERAESERIKEKYAVILLDGEGYAGALRSLLSDKRARSLCKSGAKIGRFGIIGALSELCEGARADLSRLPADKPLPELLTSSYIGKHLIFTELRHAPTLCALAETCGLSATHFANTNDGGELLTAQMRIPLALVRTLTDSRRTFPAYVSKCDPLAEYTAEPLCAKKNEKLYDLSENKLVKSDERLISAFRISPAENSFGAALNALTDSVLRLAAAGVDRRAICSSALYEFPAEDTDAESLGESLALILGAYRVGVELAFSEGLTAVEYGDRRSLTCALYASAPRKPLSAKLSREGSVLCFLPLSTTSDGLTDLASLRRVCDELSELCRKGKVLSTAPVTGSLCEALDAISGELRVKLSESGEAIADVPCRGLLFEIADGERSDIIGEVTAGDAPTDE